MNARILMFHRILPRKLFGNHNAYAERGTLISLSFFQNLLGQLRNRGLEVISLKALLARHQSMELSGKEVVLTFDDGYLDVFLYVLPLLDKFGYPGELFPTLNPCLNGEMPILDWYYHLLDQSNCTQEVRNAYIFGRNRTQFDQLLYDQKLAFCKYWQQKIGISQEKFISQRLYMNEKELETWVESGRGLGGHTLSHCILPFNQKNKVEQELLACYAYARKLQADAPIFFSYPDGKFDLQSEGLVRKYGFSAALTVQWKFDQPFHPYRIPRYFVKEGFELNT